MRWLPWIGALALGATGCGANRANSPTQQPVVVMTGDLTAKTPPQKAGGRYAIQGPKDNPDPHIARQMALKQAAEAGILGVLRQDSSAGGMSGLFADDDLSEGAFGGLVGDSIGDAFGVGGLGLSGVGSGGGGTGEGTIGLGSIGTIGRGSGGGTGSGYGSGRGIGYGTGTGRVVDWPAPGVPFVSGGPMSPDEVKKVAAEHERDIEECRALERLRKSYIAGKITFAFAVDETGKVTQVSVPESSVSGTDLPSCIAQAIGAWRFPAKGGSSTSVLWAIRM